MKLKDKLKLAALHKKAAAKTITTEEQATLDGLIQVAKDAGLKVEDIAKDYAPDDGEEGDDEPEPVNGEELTNLITKAVKDATNGTGIDQDKLLNEIKALATGGKAPTLEEVEGVVKKHVGGTGIDKEALLADIKKMLPKTNGITTSELAKALDEFAKSIRQPSRNEFDAAVGNDFPIEHRSGNLTVGQKQLLNVCLSGVSDEALDSLRTKRPAGQNDGISEEQLKRAQKVGEMTAKRARHAVIYGGKALTSTGVGSGDELVPSDLSGDLQTRMYLESQLAAELMASEVEMPTNPFRFPMTTTRTSFYVGSEAPGSDPTESNPGTAEITLDAKKLIGLSQYSYEANEDAIIAILPMLQENLGSGAADAFEGALINGDTTATHQDSDIHAVTGHHAKLFKGLRKYAIAGSLTKSLATGGISADNLVAMRKMLKRWGIKPRDLMLLVGPQGYNDLVNLDETLSFEKVGSASAARILTGEAASIFGIRIVVSSQIREDLNASGVYNGSTTTKGSILLVHRPSWLVGVKRGFTVEVDKDTKRQINSVVASFRRAFTPKETPSLSLPSVVMGYNYDA